MEIKGSHARLNLQEIEYKSVHLLYFGDFFFFNKLRYWFWNGIINKNKLLVYYLNFAVVLVAVNVISQSAKKDDTISQSPIVDN